MGNKFKNLRVYNLVIGLVLLIQGLIMAAVSLPKGYVLPITTNYLKWNDPLNVSTMSLEKVGEIEIGLVVAAFLVISGLFLIAVATIFFKIYNRWINKGINPFRWMEYSVTSSLMILVIAMLCGIYDLSSLIMIVALNTCMILFGWVMEIHNQTTKRVDWISYIFGCFAGFVPWVIMSIYFFHAIATNGDAVPSFVYWIFWSLFIFFNIFAINMFLQYKRIGEWKKYIYGEYAYIILSLAAKTLLAWQVWGGTLR